MRPTLCVHMEAFAGQMGSFPSSEGPTGQKGIHRELVSNCALDVQLLLTLKFNRQVICVCTSMRSAAMKKIHKQNKRKLRRLEKKVNSIVKLKKKI